MCFKKIDSILSEELNEFRYSIVIISDHGNHIDTCHVRCHINSIKQIGLFGNAAKRDIYITTWGLLNVTMVQTNRSNMDAIRDNMVNIEGINFVVSKDSSDYLVSCSQGDARIKIHNGVPYDYIPISGDPLRYSEFANSLTKDEKNMKPAG